MRTLYLTAPSSRNEQANLQSDSVVEIMAASTRGTVLAERYKILETIEAGTFRGHDLALDQTVMVRQASLKTQGVAEFWHQKAQQLALIRDPDPLNVLDVVSENSNEFIITEWPRGRSVGDLLGEQSSLPRVDGSRALPTTALTARKNSAPLPQTREVIRKFDRETGWLATAVLAMVIFGAVGLAMKIKERHLKVRDPDNSVAFFKDLERSGGQSSGQITSVRLHDMDRALTKTSSPVSPSLPMETPAPVSTAVPVLTFIKNSHERKPNPRPWAAIHRSESSRARSFGRSKIVDVKKTTGWLMACQPGARGADERLEYSQELEEQR
jgi:hypothetical protein